MQFLNFPCSSFDPVKPKPKKTHNLPKLSSEQPQNLTLHQNTDWHQFNFYPTYFYSVKQEKVFEEQEEQVSILATHCPADVPAVWSAWVKVPDPSPAPRSHFHWKLFQHFQTSHLSNLFTHCNFFSKKSKNANISQTQSSLSHWHQNWRSKMATIGLRWVDRARGLRWVRWVYQTISCLRRTCNL